MTKFILVLNAKPIKCFTYLAVANNHFDKLLKVINKEKDSLELWSYEEGIVRAI